MCEIRKYVDPDYSRSSNILDNVLGGFLPNVCCLMYVVSDPQLHLYQKSVEVL
jgi:hypothetical protein